MARTVRYGIDSSLAIELADDALVAHCDPPVGTPLDDVASAVERALAEPLSFPPLRSSVVPGDKVVLALARAVPQAAAIVSATVEALLSAGIEPLDITLLRTLADVESIARDPLAECGNPRSPRLPRNARPVGARIAELLGEFIRRAPDLHRPLDSRRRFRGLDRLLAAA